MTDYVWKSLQLPTPGSGGTPAPNPGTMILLTDGSVLVQSYFSTNWFIFSPEPGTGQYTDFNPDPAKTNWTQVQSSQLSRDFYASGVLKDGRVFILGGEYTNLSTPDSGKEDPTGEIFDPVTQTWSPMYTDSRFNYIHGDASCAVLPDGRVIFGGQGGGSQTAIWDPTAPDAEAWVAAGNAFGTRSNSKVGICAEETWTLLQDGTVLTVNISRAYSISYSLRRVLVLANGDPEQLDSSNNSVDAFGSERYFPAVDQWVSAGNPINSLPYYPSTEIGPALSLPDGRAFFIGGDGNTGVFDPTNAAAPWTAGPSMEPSNPGNPYNPTLMAADAPAALLPNGLVLLCGGEPVLVQDDSESIVYSGSPIFFLYNPTNNSLTGMQANGGEDVTTQATVTYQCCLLLLPSGQVLLSTSSNELFTFTLDVSVNTPDEKWRPIIDSAPSVMLPRHTYTIQGRQLMGLSEGCNYGDDRRNATNYPIVRIIQGPGTVYYCRTYDFSSMGISPTESQSFTVEIPQNVPPGAAGPPTEGTYMEVIANGIPSDPFPVTISSWDCQILTELDLIGQGIVNAVIRSSGNAIVKSVLKVWVDGFTPSQLGLNSQADLAKPPSNPPTISLSPNIDLQFEVYAPILAEDESLPDTPQRFAFQFQADFTDQATSDAIFSNLGGDLLTLQLNAQFTSTDNITVSAEGFIGLTTNPTPYFKHADPTVGNGAEWWLSTDLRAFQITENVPKYFNLAPSPGNPQTAATDYISNLIGAFNNPPQGVDPDQVFESLPLTEDDPNSVTLSTTDNSGDPVYNFCIARVNFANTAASASDVRVFFRLFPGAQGYATYDPNALYRSGPTSDGGRIPLIGTVTPGSDKIGTMPFFAKPRVDSLVVSTAAQPQDSPNVMTLDTTAPGQTKSYFFGAWLDINQAQPPVYPVTLLGILPGNLPDGPYIGVQDVETILDLIRSTHQCLIAEINFSDDPISVGSNPSNCQQLAQRNLVWQSVANPGVQGSRQASVPFEIRPTPSILAAQRTFDEIVIQWDQVPLGSLLSVYLPVVQATDIVKLANVMYSSNSIQVVDPNTISVVVTGTITYIPIPTQTSNDPFVGLLSLGCPLGIRKGQVFNVTVKQITTNAKVVQPPPPTLPPPPAPQIVQVQPPSARSASTAQVAVNTNAVTWRRVLGQFRLAIPVSTKADLLEPEERTLSILRFIELSIPVTDRWYLVFKRYVDDIAGRVSGLGGDPATIYPDPNGGVKPRKRCHRRHDVWVGRVCELIYDCCGKFCGFEIERRERRGVERKVFKDVERDMEKLIERLFEKRWVLEVFTFKERVCELKIKDRDDECE